jgi:hypothetical protein
MSSLVVPGEVAAAVTTRRPELLTPLRVRVGKDGLDAASATALLDLVRDAILEAQKDDERYRALLVRLESLRATAKGLLTALDKLTAEMTGGPQRDDNDE